jgi:hypothetical protein
MKASPTRQFLNTHLERRVSHQGFNFVEIIGYIGCGPSFGTVLGRIGPSAKSNGQRVVLAMQAACRRNAGTKEAKRPGLDMSTWTSIRSGIRIAKLGNWLYQAGTNRSFSSCIVVVRLVADGTSSTKLHNDQTPER